MKNSLLSNGRYAPEAGNPQQAPLEVTRHLFIDLFRISRRFCTTPPPAPEN